MWLVTDGEIEKEFNFVVVFNFLGELKITPLATSDDVREFINARKNLVEFGEFNIFTDVTSSFDLEGK